MTLVSPSLSVIAFLLSRVKGLNEISIFKVLTSLQLIMQVTGPTDSDCESEHINVTLGDWMISTIFFPGLTYHKLCSSTLSTASTKSLH